MCFNAPGLMRITETHGSLTGYEEDLWPQQARAPVRGTKGVSVGMRRMSTPPIVAYIASMYTQKSISLFDLSKNFSECDHPWQCYSHQSRSAPS